MLVDKVKECLNINKSLYGKSMLSTSNIEKMEKKGLLKKPQYNIVNNHYFYFNHTEQEVSYL